MPTVVSYNTIILNNVITTAFEQTPIYDDSGTDVIASKFSMSFEGICHAQGDTNSAPAWIGGGGSYSSSGSRFPTVQQAFNNICQMLWQPRQKLIVSMGGVPLFLCNPCDSGTQYDDVQNGPKPKAVHLSKITANNTVGPTFHVTFDIECVRTACPTGTILPVLSNRWSISEGFDDEYFTQRTISGQIVLSSSKLSADAYRYLVVPTLENGFKRERLDWNIHPDGLKIDYTVTDKQVETAPPWPAAKMTVRHSESTSTQGSNFEGECHVMLHGCPGAPKAALLSLAVRIIENRLGKIKSMPGNNAMVPVMFSMVDTIGERNELEVYLKIQHAAPVNNKNNYLGTPIGTIGTDLDSGLPITPIAPGYPATYDAAKSPVPNPWGYNPDGTGRVSQIANLTLQCFVQAPCGGSNRWIYQSQAAGEPTGQNPQQPPTQTDMTVYNYPNLPSYSPGSLPDLQSTANQTAMFTHAAGETILTLDPLRVPLPIAGDPTQYDGASDTCVLITLGWPQARITFHVEAERVGQWPAVPEPVPSFTMKGITGNLISAVLTPMPPTTDATSTSKILHVSARITYALNRPPARTDTIPLGVLQWTEYTPSQNALQLLSIYDAGVQPFSGGTSPSPGPGVKY